MCLLVHQHARYLPYYAGSVVFQNSDLVHPTTDPLGLYMAPQFAIFVDPSEPSDSNGCPGDVYIREISPRQYTVFVKSEAQWISWTNNKNHQAIDYPNLKANRRLFCPSLDGTFYHGRTNWIRLKKSMGPAEISEALRTSVHLFRVNAPHDAVSEIIPENVERVLQPLIQKSLLDHLLSQRAGSSDASSTIYPGNIDPCLQCKCYFI